MATPTRQLVVAIVCGVTVLILSGCSTNEDSDTTSTLLAPASTIEATELQPGQRYAYVVTEDIPALTLVDDLVIETIRSQPTPEQELPPEPIRTTDEIHGKVASTDLATGTIVVVGTFVDPGTFCDNGQGPGGQLPPGESCIRD